MGFPKKPLTTRAAAIKYVRLFAKAKALYGECDALLDQVIAAKPTKSFTLKDGSRIALVNNYAGKNKVWKSTCTNLLDIKAV